jgi:hypothetical protein
LHGKLQALAASICDGRLGGRKRKFDLSKGVVVAGLAHQRLDVGSRAALETQLPLLDAGPARSHR